MSFLLFFTLKYYYFIDYSKYDINDPSESVLEIKNSKCHMNEVQNLVRLRGVLQKYPFSSRYCISKLFMKNYFLTEL